jgi:hypothetical protein
MPSYPINEAPTPVKGWTFIPTPPDTNLGHFHENMVELWIMLEGTLGFLIEGELLITGTVGDSSGTERNHVTESVPAPSPATQASTPAARYT